MKDKNTKKIVGQPRKTGSAEQAKSPQATHDKQARQPQKKGNKIFNKKAKKKKRLSFKASVVIVTVINLLALGFLFYVLSNLKGEAINLKKLRSASIDAQEKSKVEVADLQIQSYIDKSDYLMSLFPDESGLIDFVKEIEKLKNEGVVKNFAFANEDAVHDKTKVLGIPFVLRMEGTWEQIDSDLKKIQSMPFIVRAVTLDIQVKEEETNLIDFRYGGFIYVDESLAKN
jgi:Tfp pilus assembly protein PilO